KWSILGTALNDVNGQSIGDLRILRPLTPALQRFTDLRLEIAGMWAVAILFALLLTFVAAHRLLAPIKLLETGAREVAKGNYQYRVAIEGDDEIGRLGQSFNAMAASVRQSREELIRQERLHTLGRIASSVVHDLRNPLAAIYSGAELLVDSDAMPVAHTRRLAANIYRSSRQVLSQLDDLLALTRGNAPAAENCRVAEVIEDAWSTVSAQAESAGVSLAMDGAKELEAVFSRSRMERVFGNLFANAIEAMPQGGEIRVHMRNEANCTVVSVADTGPGVPLEVRNSLFQPFTTAGKSNGLGLGLALSRQTVLEHGGDLALEDSAGGACFRVSLPAQL
ncbi:MAG: HAMP domain-containing histidine kinase, partial [Bryobacteraceae bacterium]|nr:HAMP domain-containing histidine kinase [Bryobacteraceae bacterium]